MNKCLLIFTLFATAWQVTNAEEDWGARLQAEQQWLLQSLAPKPQEVEASLEGEVEEDSISTGQAAPVRAQTELKPVEYPNPWGPQNQGESYQPARKRSR